MNSNIARNGNNVTKLENKNTEDAERDVERRFCSLIYNSISFYKFANEVAVVYIWSERGT